MSEQHKSTRWTRVRAIGLNLAAVGIGGGAATNLAEDVPVVLLCIFSALLAVGCGMVIAACWIGGRPLPRLWPTLTRPRKDSQQGISS